VSDNESQDDLDSKNNDSRNDGLQYPFSMSSFLLKDEEQQNSYLQGAGYRYALSPKETQNTDPFNGNAEGLPGAIAVLLFIVLVVVPLGKAFLEDADHLEKYIKGYLGGMKAAGAFENLRFQRMFSPIGRQTDVMLSGELLNIHVGFDLKNIERFTRCQVIEHLPDGQVKVVIPAEKKGEEALTLDLPEAYLTPYKTEQQIEQKDQSLRVKKGTEFAVVVSNKLKVHEGSGKQRIDTNLPAGTKVKVLDVFSRYNTPTARILVKSWGSQSYDVSPDDLMAIPANEYNEKEKYKSDLRSEFHQSSAVYVSNKAGSGFVASAPDARGYRTVTTFSPSRSTLG